MLLGSLFIPAYLFLYLLVVLFVIVILRILPIKKVKINRRSYRLKTIAFVFLVCLYFVLLYKYGHQLDQKYSNYKTFDTSSNDASFTYRVWWDQLNISDIVDYGDYYAVVGFDAEKSKSVVYFMSQRMYSYSPRQYELGDSESNYRRKIIALDDEKFVITDGSKIYKIDRTGKIYFELGETPFGEVVNDLAKTEDGFVVVGELTQGIPNKSAFINYYDQDGKSIWHVYTDDLSSRYTNVHVLADNTIVVSKEKTYNYFLEKYNAQGTLLWNQPSKDLICDITSYNNQIITVGRLNKEILMSKKIGELNKYRSYYGVIKRIEPTSGKTKWQKEIGGYSSYVGLNSVIVDSQHNIAITGQNNSVISQGLILKYDLNGNEIYTAQGYNFEGRKILQDSSGGYMILGDEVIRNVVTQSAYFQFFDYHLTPVKIDQFDEVASKHNYELSLDYRRFYEFEKALKYISFGLLGLIGLFYLVSNSPEGELSKEDEEKLLRQKQEDMRNNQFR